MKKQSTPPEVLLCPTLCRSELKFTGRRYKVTQIDDFSGVGPTDALIFDIGFKELAECIEIQTHTLVHADYFAYVLENEVPPFKIGLNLHYNLSLYKVIVTGFKPDRAAKYMYRSIAIGLNAQILNPFRTVEELKQYAKRLTLPNSQFLFLVQQPYQLLALLQYLDDATAETVLARTFPPQALERLIGRMLTRQQVIDILNQNALDTIHGLKINTFKLPTMNMGCVFNKVDFIKDAPAESISNLLGGKCFMSIVSQDYRFAKYTALSASTHFIDDKLAVCKAQGYIDANGRLHRYFGFTSDQLRAQDVSHLSLVLTYSKPIVIVVDYGFSLPFPSDVPGQAKILDSCTVLPFDVMVERNLRLFEQFHEKIIALCSKPQEVPEAFRYTITTMSCFWFRCLQAEQLGAVIRSTKKLPLVLSPAKAADRNIVSTPNVLNYRMNGVLHALSFGSFLTTREELPISAEEVLNQIFEVLPPFARAPLHSYLQEQLSFGKTAELSINISQLFYHLYNGVPVKRAVENSKAFEQNYISGYMDSYYSGANMSRVEDAKDEMMVDLDDEVFTVEQSPK